MSKAWLIIIWGLPCTGKTTLGPWLAKELGLPFVHKDGIKESLFESLGWKDRAWSKQLSSPPHPWCGCPPGFTSPRPLTIRNRW